LTWLDVLAGNIGAMLWLAGVVFAYRDWRFNKQWFAGALCWMLILLGGSIFAYRAGCWANTWACSSNPDPLGILQ
jgi:hypothetical protein